MGESIAILKKSFEDKLEKLNSIKDLEAMRIEFMGKNGKVQECMQVIGSLPPEERKEFGAKVNELKDFIKNELESRRSLFEKLELEKKLADEVIDVTLPARHYQTGKIHPISKTIEDLKSIFKELGFSCIEGNEIEDEWHNFSALNIPDHHPARQSHDTFYLEDGKLLRTHTSNMQIRYMLANKPPYRIVSIGKVYRSDYDATHSPMFHQIECLYIDKGINMSHLKWCLETFLKMFFGLDKLPIRLRPNFFPFTEPSAEVDIRCDRQSKSEIKIGEGNDWIELLGSGMVHPNVLRNVGVDPEEYQGFAFGAGIERLAMLKYNIPDLRTMFEGNIRWLKHFGSSAIPHS